jgi:hypothetical protein
MRRWAIVLATARPSGAEFSFDPHCQGAVAVAVVAAEGLESGQLAGVAIHRPEFGDGLEPGTAGAAGSTGATLSSRRRCHPASRPCLSVRQDARRERPLQAVRQPGFKPEPLFRDRSSGSVLMVRALPGHPPRPHPPPLPQLAPQGGTWRLGRLVLSGDMRQTGRTSPVGTQLTKGASFGLHVSARRHRWCQVPDSGGCR